MSLRSPAEVAKAAVDAAERRKGIKIRAGYRAEASAWARLLLPERDEELAGQLLVALDDPDPAARLRALAEELRRSR